MFNPFNPFQSAVNTAATTANNAGGANRAADATFGTAPNPFANSFTGPFTGNPFVNMQGGIAQGFSQAQSTMQNGMQEWQRMLQAFMNPQKLFDPQTYKDLLPKELTQAWAAFTPGAMQEQASQATQAFQNAAQSMQGAMQGAMRSAAKSATEAASDNGYKGGMSSTFGSSLGSVDVGAFVAAQQKNMETLASAQSAAMQGWQQIMKRQAEIFHDTIQTASTAMSDLMATGAPEEKLARQADIAKQAFEAAGRNVEELSQLVTKGQQEALRVVNARVQESLDEIKRAAQSSHTSAPVKQAANAAANAASSVMQQGAQAAQSMMQAAGSTGSQTVAAASDAVQ